MSTLKAVGKWIVAIGGALVVGLLSALMYGSRRFKEGWSTGEATQRAKDDREDLQRAEEKGDDDAVLEEWRKHR